MSPSSRGGSLKKVTDSQVASRVVDMDRSSATLDGEMVGNTATPTPKQTGGGIFFQETTAPTPTDDGAFRNRMEMVEKNNNTYAYVQTSPSRPLKGR